MKIELFFWTFLGDTAFTESGIVQELEEVSKPEQIKKLSEKNIQDNNNKLPAVKISHMSFRRGEGGTHIQEMGTHFQEGALLWGFMLKIFISTYINSFVDKNKYYIFLKTNLNKSIEFF